MGRRAIGVAAASCCLAAALASALALSGQTGQALGPSDGRYVKELSIGYGPEGVITLDLEGYKVGGQPLCEESEAYLGYKRGSDGITDLVLSSVNGSVAVDGREYEQVQELDVFDGQAGPGYLYESRDAASGSQIVALTVEAGSGLEDDPLLALRNDGTSPVRDEMGRVADFGINVPTYLFMLREGVCRPYVSDAGVVFGADLREAVLAAAEAGFDYYWDMGLTTTDGDYALIGYNRSANESEAITCITARPEQEETYAVGSVTFELMGGAVLDSEVPYRLFLTRDPAAGNPILDFDYAGLRDAGTMGTWAERTFVKFGGLLSGQQAKSEQAYADLRQDNQSLTCVPVILADAEVAFREIGELTLDDEDDGTDRAPGEEQAAQDREGARPADDAPAAPVTEDAVVDEAGEPQALEGDNRLTAEEEAQHDAIEREVQREEAEESGEDALLGADEQELSYLNAQGVEAAPTSDEDVPATEGEATTSPAPQEGVVEGMGAPEDAGAEASPNGPTSNEVAPKVEAEPVTGGSDGAMAPAKEDAQHGDTPSSVAEDDSGETDEDADEDEDDEEDDIAYCGIEMPLGYVCAEKDLPVSLFAQEEEAEESEDELAEDPDKKERTGESDASKKQTDAKDGDSNGTTGQAENTASAGGAGQAPQDGQTTAPAGTEQQDVEAQDEMDEGVPDETEYVVESPSESYREFIEAHESNELVDDFDEETYLQDEAVPLDRGPEADTNVASAFGEGDAQGVAISVGMAVAGMAAGYGCFLIGKRREAAGDPQNDVKGGGEDE